LSSQAPQSGGDNTTTTTNNDDEWELVAPACLKDWKRRGIVGKNNNGLTPEQAKCLLRVHPQEDGTNGFFVACFQRKNNSDPKSTAVWKGIKQPPPGMEFYQGQFKNEKIATQKKESSSVAKPSESTKAVATGQKKQTGKKRKVEPSTTKAVETDKKRKVESSTTTTTTNLSKKRAKKMDWKKKQREKKFARVKKNETKESS
jgi:hypothetical protein